MKTNLRKIDFQNQVLFTGLDVHQKTWHATLLIGEVQKSQSFERNPEKFAEYLKKNYPGATYKLAYEAGCFGFWIKERMEPLGIETIVVNPADIPTTDKDNRQKTDKNDSKKIAWALRSGLLNGIYVPDKEAQEERDLLRRRSDLIKKSTRIKNQIKAKLKFYGIEYPERFEKSGTHWSKCFLQWLASIKFESSSMKFVMNSLLREIKFIREEILIVTKQLRSLLKSEKHAEDTRILKSIPGIGEIATATILLEIMDIKRFKTSNEFLSFVGLAPTEHSSGIKRQIGHLNRRCNASLRTVFIEAAWIAIRNDPALTLYFNNCLKRGTKTYAIVKVAKKLANRTRYVWLNQCEYSKGVAA